MADDLPGLLDDTDVAKLLGYADVATFRRRRKQLEAEGFPKRRPVVKRYSPAQIRAWIDGATSELQQSDADPLLGVADKWGASK